MFIDRNPQSVDWGRGTDSSVESGVMAVACAHAERVLRVI